MDPIHVELARFLRAHAVRRDAAVLVAISGGADSVALLHALIGVGQRVAAAHVHHGLRGREADADLSFVADLSRSLGVPFAFAKVDAAARDGRSPEARARSLRYEALERMRAAGNHPHLATAHHLDDQAETVLLRAVRGTGIGGLAAIRPSLDGGRVLRPLLGTRRADLRRYLADRGLSFREDATNADPATPRNRLRLEILPALESMHPGASERLASLAALAAEQDAALIGALDGRLEQLSERGDGGLWLDAAKLAELEIGQRRRALLALAAREGLDAALSRAHVERIDAFVARAATGRQLSLPGGFKLLRDRDRLWLGPSIGPSPPAPLHVEVPLEGSLEFPERGLRLSWHPCTAPDPPRRLLRLPARPQLALIARSPSAGDRIFSRGRERSLKEAFAGARWSRQARARAVVVERNGEIVWVPGLFRSESARDGEGWRELRAVCLPSPH